MGSHSVALPHGPKQPNDFEQLYFSATMMASRVLKPHSSLASAPQCRDCAVWGRVGLHQNGFQSAALLHALKQANDSE